MNEGKYKKGEKITSLDELMNQDFIYWHDKITAFAWFQNWQIRMAKNAIDSGIISFAVKNTQGGGVSE